jgi:hypothetical protein
VEGVFSEMASNPLTKQDLAQLAVAMEATKQSKGVLNDYVDARGSQALNVLPPTSLESILDVKKEGLLKSDADAELLLILSFKGFVNLKGLRVQANPELADDDFSPPEELRIYKNEPSMIFSDVHDGDIKPVCTVSLTPKMLLGEEVIKLQPHKFNNVKSVSLFLTQEDYEATFMTNLTLLGDIRDDFNMNNLKKSG